jgi:hypothetical protein
VGKNHLEDLGTDGRDNIKMDLRNGMGRHELVLSGSGLGQVAGACVAVMNFRVPLNVGNSLASRGCVSF